MPAALARTVGEDDRLPYTSIDVNFALRQGMRTFYADSLVNSA